MTNGTAIMRLVFIDLHCINFLLRPYDQIKANNKIATYKHKFILDYAFEHKIPVCNYISGKESTVPYKGAYLVKHDKSKRLASAESKYVTRNSFEKPLNIILITDKNEIRADDIVIGYFYKESQRDLIKELPGHKVLMGNHFVSIDKPFDLDELNIEGFVNEIDLSDNKFINRYIKFSGKYITCPYIYADRFIDQGKKRLNKSMAIGTLSTCEGAPGYKLYRDMFQTEWIQNMRKEIYEKACDNPALIDSYISYIYEDKVKISSDDTALMKLYKSVKNKFKPWRQSKYMSFDMVDKFNEYAFFVCPEENVGMPGIGFVEGMACGTTYIGLDTEYYRKLGLIPDVHYISYDGTYGGLLEKIKYCQNNYSEMRKIGQTGRDFIRMNFSRSKVAADFFVELKKLSES